MKRTVTKASRVREQVEDNAPFLCTLWRNGPDFQAMKIIQNVTFMLHAKPQHKGREGWGNLDAHVCTKALGNDDDDSDVEDDGDCDGEDNDES